MYRCIPEGPTQHYIIIHNPKILHVKIFCTSQYLRKKISSEKKLSHYSLIHPCALYTSSSTSIDYIKLDHFPLGRNTKKLIQPKQVYSTHKFESKISLFSFFSVRIVVRLRVRVMFQSPTGPQ